MKAVRPTPMSNGHSLHCSRFCSCKIYPLISSFPIARWAQTIGHDNPRGGSSPVPSQLNSGHSCSLPPNRISSLLEPGNDNRMETRAILSYILIKELGSDFEGSDRLLLMADSAPACAKSVYTAMLKVPLEQRVGIKNLTEKVSLDPRSYQHQITKVFKEIVTHTPHYEAGKPSFGMLMCLIVYLVELCRRFLDHGSGCEIPSIHNTACRLMLDDEHRLSPANWAEYLDSHPQREKPPLERRPSLGDAAAIIFYAVEAYSKFTK